MIDDQEAIQNVARMNFDLAQRDADRIKELDHEIKVQIKKNKLQEKLFKTEKKELWLDMNRKLQALKKEYAQYKAMTVQEINVNHAIIEKQQDMLNKMYTELRQTKVMIEIPRLRYEINKQDLKGIDFTQFTDLVEEIQKNVKADLQRE